MYGNWSKKDITTRIELLNSLTIHTAKADWSNWPKSITITVDGETTTHKTLKAAYEVLFQTDRFYEDREPETTTTENKEEEPKMKKLTAAQQKVIDSIKARATKFAGKTYEEVYSQKEDRTNYTKYVYEMAQKSFYIVYALKATIDNLVKRGLIETEGTYSTGCQFVKLVETAEPETTTENEEEETMTNLINELTKMGFKVEQDRYGREIYTATIVDDCDNTLEIYFGTNTEGKINARADKINGTHKWYYDKTARQVLAVVRQCMEGHTFPEPEVEDKKEEETMKYTIKSASQFETIGTANTMEEAEAIAEQYEMNNATDEAIIKEETTMENTEIELTTPKTFEREGGRSAVTITKLWRRLPTDKWALVDDDHVTWYRKPQWDEDGKIAYYIPDSCKGQRILMTEQELNDMINNTKEETTMKTTLNLTEGVAKFDLNGTTYCYHIDSKRYAKTTSDGKTKRISKAEYDEAKASHDQQVLDDQPSRVEIENDLDKPAVLDQYGCVDCRKCNCDRCVHRNCMRRNPRNVGGLGECPRLDNGIMGEGQKIAEEEGIEPAEAELEANIRAEQKKLRKARKSKDIAYEGHGKTLTAKQVDFIIHLSDSCFWEHGLESALWTDVLCDDIGGQFAGKPMTVGAMISTLCEKGLAERAKGKVNNRTATYMVLTELGKEIAKELGLE